MRRFLMGCVGAAVHLAPPAAAAHGHGLGYAPSPSYFQAGHEAHVAKDSRGITFSAHRSRETALFEGLIHLHGAGLKVPAAVRTKGLSKEAKTSAANAKKEAVTFNKLDKGWFGK